MFYWKPADPTLTLSEKEFGVFYGYDLTDDPTDLTGNNDGYNHINTRGRRGTATGTPFYEDVSPIGCPAIVIHKK
ncbi:MAG: hypothetical protein J6F31_00155 [Oscillospiraceae bacterium]|nr:hypothetical protein [Oscillospiraceae bacterium]